MNSTPKAEEPLIREFADALTRPTYRRFVVLLLACILTTGRRTVTNLLRTVSAPAPGHPSSYHRDFSKRRWSSRRLARALAGYILRHWVPDGPVNLCGDDTVDGHRGKKVYSKACHRDEYFFTTDPNDGVPNGCRNLHRSLVHRNHLPGDARLS